MRIAAGSDHAGYRLKSRLVEHLQQSGVEVVDLGVHGLESVDYPDYAVAVARAVSGGEVSWGLLVCGTGIGVCMAANKIAGVRAATVTDAFTAAATRLHNDANVLCLGERVIGEGVALSILDAWMATAFEGGRHQRRVNKINALDDRS